MSEGGRLIYAIPDTEIEPRELILDRIELHLTLPPTGLRFPRNIAVIEGLLLDLVENGLKIIVSDHVIGINKSEVIAGHMLEADISGNAGPLILLAEDLSPRIICRKWHF